jgi:hypothetical protein
MSKERKEGKGEKPKLWGIFHKVCAVGMNQWAHRKHGRPLNRDLQKITREAITTWGGLDKVDEAFYEKLEKERQIIESSGTFDSIGGIGRTPSAPISGICGVDWGFLENEE